MQNAPVLEGQLMNGRVNLGSEEGFVHLQHSSFDPARHARGCEEDVDVWSKYDFLGGFNNSSLPRELRARLTDHILRDKISMGTLLTWEKVTFDIFFWFYAGIDAQTMRLQTLCKPPRLEMLSTGLQHCHYMYIGNNPLSKKTLEFIKDNCRSQKEIINLALANGFPQDKLHSKSTGVRDNTYGSRRLDGHRGSADRGLKRRTTDEDIEHFEKRRRKAIEQKQRVLAEQHAAKAVQKEQVAKQSDLPKKAPHHIHNAALTNLFDRGVAAPFVPVSACVAGNSLPGDPADNMVICPFGPSGTATITTALLHVLRKSRNA
jgi:hypothetical protein